MLASLGSVQCTWPRYTTQCCATTRCEGKVNHTIVRKGGLADTALLWMPDPPPPCVVTHVPTTYVDHPLREQEAAAIQRLCQHTHEGESRLLASTQARPCTSQVAHTHCMLHRSPQDMVQYAQNQSYVPLLTVKHGA